MKPARYLLILAVVACLSPCRTLAEPERGRIRGVFVERGEQQVAEQQYMVIVVKPLDRDDHMTLIVPRSNEDLMQAVRRLERGRQVTAAFVVEREQRWLERIAVEGGRRDGEQPPVERRVLADQPRLIRAADSDGPRPVRQAEQPDVRRPEGERPAVRRIEGDRPEGDVEEARRVIGDSMERLMGAFRRLTARVDQLERENQRLREQNERLRRMLVESGIRLDEPQEVEIRRDGDRPAADRPRPREGEPVREGDRPLRDR